MLPAYAHGRPTSPHGEQMNQLNKHGEQEQCKGQAHIAKRTTWLLLVHSLRAVGGFTRTRRYST
eukprot:15446683-Alexandrium_andersonii.AAC.1